MFQGDSGGALVIDNSGGLMQIGVASFVSSAGFSSGFPLLFTRVSSFRAWIRTHTGI